MGTLESYYNFYYGPIYKKNIVVTGSEKFVFSKPISFYSSYTGTNTSYGFYAPNVSSQFIFSFYVFDSLGIQIGAKLCPDFKQKESLLRFSLCTSLELNKMGIEQLNLRNENLNNYLKVMIHQIAMFIIKDYPRAMRVDSKVYLYDYPTIKEFLSGKREDLIVTDEYIFEKI